MNSNNKITGLLAPIFTPMNSDKSINFSLIPLYLERLRAEGVIGTFVCGTTGEFSSLTIDERKSMAEAVVVASKETPDMIHVGDNCLENSCLLAKHAEEIGASAIAAMSPTYFKPANLNQLIDCCKTIASAAPTLSFYYYHIPQMNGISLPMADFVPEAKKQIPNFAGVKFTHENLADFIIAAETAGVQLLFGRDEMLLAGITTGAKAAIGSTYNFAAPLYSRLWKLFNAGDLKAAREEQLHASKLLQVLGNHGQIAAMKRCMKLCGFDVGPCRLPLIDLDDQQEKALEKDLQEIGFFDWGRA